MSIKSLSILDNDLTVIVYVSGLYCMSARGAAPSRDCRYFTQTLALYSDPEVTANIYCKSRNLPNTDTLNNSTDLRITQYVPCVRVRYVGAKQNVIILSMLFHDTMIRGNCHDIVTRNQVSATKPLP